MHPKTGVFLLKVKWVGWGREGDTEEPMHNMVADDPYRVEEYITTVRCLIKFLVHAGVLTRGTGCRLTVDVRRLTVVSRIFFYRSFNASYVYFLQELDVSLWTLDIFLREDLTGVTSYCVSKQRRTHKTTYRNTRKTCLLVTPVKRTRKPQAERRTRKTTKILSYGSRSRKVNSTVVMYLSQRQTDDVM